MTDNKQKMLGAYFPENYEREIVDRFQQQHPHMPMTSMVRALVGLWFNGKIKITQADLKRYRLDRRKYTIKPRPRIPDGIEGEGWQAAASGIPMLANPYKLTKNASGVPEVDYEAPDAVAWAKGWNSYYTTQGD